MDHGGDDALEEAQTFYNEAIKLSACGKKDARRL